MTRLKRTSRCCSSTLTGCSTFRPQSLRKIPAFVKLFKDAFPNEAAADNGDLMTLVSDDTELRAQA